MQRWLWMTGGLGLWAVAFSALYALSSLADVVDRADALPWRMAGLAVSLACAIGCVVLLGLALRRRRTGPPSFVHDIAALSAGLGLLATIWQALPTLIGH